jgi:hypothetical protein
MRAVALGAAMEGVRFEVVMADRSRWEYAATAERERLPGGEVALVYTCRGRV